MSAVHLARAPGGSEPYRSLVLAGGGMRVAYQAGVLLALEEAGLRFAHADGTSGGTINLAMLFSGLSPTQMSERWASLDIRDFVSFLPLVDYAKLEGPVAFGDADGIVQKVFPHLGIDVGKINAATGMVATFNVCNFTTKSNCVVTEVELTLDLLVAGISLPVVMPPVRVGADYYVDSVWIKDANLLAAVERGAQEIWLVWCIGNSAQYRNGPFNQYVHMIEISANAGLFAELATITELNRRIARGDSPFGQREPITVKVVRPLYPLPLDPSYYIGAIDGHTLVALGYADAALRLRHDAGPDPLNEGSTRMRTPRQAVSFKEHWSGRVTWQAGTTRDLQQLGEDFELRLSAFVHNLPQFMRDGRQSAQLCGSLRIGRGPLAYLRDGELEAHAEGDGLSLTYRAVADYSGTLLSVVAVRRIAVPGLVHITLRANAKQAAPFAAVATQSGTALHELMKTVKAIEPASPLEALDTLNLFGTYCFGPLWRALRAKRCWWKFW